MPPTAGKGHGNHRAPDDSSQLNNPLLNLMARSLGTIGGNDQVGGSIGKLQQSLKRSVPSTGRRAAHGILSKVAHGTGDQLPVTG